MRSRKTVVQDGRRKNRKEGSRGQGKFIHRRQCWEGRRHPHQTIQQHLQNSRESAQKVSKDRRTSESAVRNMWDKPLALRQERGKKIKERKKNKNSR
jgi:hypothetical protein